MSKARHVYAMFDRLDDALAAYAEVQAGGCSTEHCSAMVHEKHIDEGALTGAERASREGAAEGAAVAGTAGVVLGGLAALGGGILGVGPLAAAAFAGGVMAAYGALIGGIAGSDGPVRHLRALQRELESGKILIAIETDDPKLEAMCDAVFGTTEVAASRSDPADGARLPSAGARDSRGKAATGSTLSSMLPTAPLGLSTRYLFFTGKGGVGKTTLACATALALAAAGKRVLIVSTDPASNLDEMLGVRLGPEPRPIAGAPGLCAANIDPEQAAEDYRHRVLAPYEGVVSSEELAQMREELAGACTTEIAAFDRFAGLLAGDDDGFDHVVFDTAPTGHTLRLLDLPRAWTSFLDQNTRGASCLGPHGGLTTRHDRFMDARRALEDSERTTVVLVTRPETAALREVDRTSAELRSIGLLNQRLVVNGVFRATIPDDAVAVALQERGRAALASMPPTLSVLPRFDVPLRAYEMVGLEALRAVLRDDDPGGSAPAPARVATSLPPLSLLVDEIVREPRGLVMVMGKGGVGKTTIASAIAVAVAERGVEVLLSTTDPAAHVAATVEGVVPRLEVSRIDPAAETRAYVESILATKGRDLDDEGRALLLEDLRSPCTEEVAVFHAFSRTVSRARQGLVVLDTAPTGHTLLLLDATGSYHREMLRRVDRDLVHRLTTPLMRLRDPSFTKILLVTLPETTPVSEASRLQDDLRRADIEPWAWVLNASLTASGTRDPVLARRVAIELTQIERVRTLARRIAVVPWSAREPRGVAALRAIAT